MGIDRTFIHRVTLISSCLHYYLLHVGRVIVTSVLRRNLHKMQTVVCEIVQQSKCMVCE